MENREFTGRTLKPAGASWSPVNPSMNVRPARGLGAIALAFALLAAASPALAGTYGFGTTVSKNDYDFTPVPSAVSASLCYLNVDGSLGYNVGEPVYIDVSSTSCAGSVTVDDIRLFSIDGRYPAGSSVAGADDDAQLRVFATTGALTHFVRFFDANGDVKFKAPETLYIDLLDTAALTVGAGDIRVTPYGPYAAGTVVRPGDEDMSNALTEIKSGGASLSTSGVVFKAASGYYVNTDAGALLDITKDFVVEENDVRLNAKAATPLTDRPTLQVTNIQLSPDPVAPGAPFRAIVTVKNSGAAYGSMLLETLVSDVIVDSRGTPGLNPGATLDMVVTLQTPPTPGCAAIRIGDSAALLEVAGTPAGPSSNANLEARVAALEAESGDGVSQAGANSPGFAPLLLLGAVVGAVVLRRRFL